jgi:hypothetical protein
MQSLVKYRAWLGALAVASCLGLSVTSAAAAEKITPQTLVDRQQILDQITRYYYNFGRGKEENQADYYTEDGVLILGTRRYEGRAGIMQAYSRAGAPRPPAAAAGGAAPPSGAAPAAGGPPAAGAAAAPAAPRERTAFNVVIDNPLIVVHGDNTATSEVIFTEYRQEKAGDPMKMTTQGKEYATWAKVNGKWLYKTRQIAGGSVPPDGWKE